MIPLKLLKRHITVDQNYDDTLIDFYLAGAIAQTEAHTGRVIQKKTISETFRCFEFELKGPLVSVESIQYYDTNDILQTLSSAIYDVELGLHPKILLAYDQDWPDISVRRDAVTVNYTAGYTQSTLPKNLANGIAIMVAHLYDNREALSAVKLYEMPMSYQTFVAPYVECKIV